MFSATSCACRISAAAARSKARMSRAPSARSKSLATVDRLPVIRRGDCLDALRNPAHRRHRHAVPKRPVTWAVLCPRYRGVVVGEPLETLALARRQTAHVLAAQERARVA